MDIDFREVLDLANRTGHFFVETTPERSEGGRWSQYRARLSVGGIEAPMSILYLHPGLDSRDDLARATQLLKSDTAINLRQIVYAESLVEGERRFPGVALGAGADGIPRLGVREFFWSFAKQQLSEYFSQLKNRYTLNDYVAPQLRSEQLMGDRDASLLLWNTLLGRPDGASTGPSISVLIAEPGQGKTYFSQFLTQRLALSGRIPLFVESQQWAELSRSDLGSLWKTTLNAFRVHNAPIAWADGAEERFLKVAQKCGLFTLIFDGFDEYVLRTGAETNATDTILKFRDLAGSSGARLLLTSRTIFWEAEAAAFEESLRGSEVDGFIYQLQPFNRTQASVYFSQRFPEAEESAVAAIAVFDSLKRQGTADNVDLVGRGMFLFLVADLVNNSNATELTHEPMRKIANPLEWICQRLCEREKKRQEIGLTWEVQFLVFEELAEVIALEGAASTQVLAILIGSYAEDLSPRIEMLIGIDGKRSGKLAFHPMLRQKEDWSWGFRQEQLFFFFLARRVLSQIDGKSHAALRMFLAKLERKKQLQFEIATVLLDLVLGSEGAALRLEEVVHTIARLEAEANPIQEVEGMSSIATSMAIQAVNKMRPKAPKSDRTALLMDLLDSGALRNLVFADTLMGFDFTGVQFDNCRFENVTFLRCEFDERTAFRSCTFEAITTINSRGLAKSRFDEKCSYDADFRRHLLAGTLQTGTMRYSLADLRTDFDLVLARLAGDHVSPPVVTEQDLERGRVGNSPCREELFRALRQYVMEERRQATGEKRYCLRKAALPALIFHRANGVFTGPLLDAWTSASKQLNPEER